jgi:transcriptional regulator with XRE-family HTH domain
MDKAEHGKRLAAAMAARRKGRQEVADVTGRGVRTITNWTAGETMPSDTERAALRRLLGDYDNPGDPVEVAVRSSALMEWRQDAVLSVYKRNLHEQRAEEASGGVSA